MEVTIADLLHEIGIPANLLGYTYLKAAIELAYNDESYLRALVKKLYPEIAQSYNTTVVRVERAIRHAIEVVWDRGNTALLDRMFSPIISTARGKATNSEFISTIVEELKNR